MTGGQGGRGADWAKGRTGRRGVSDKSWSHPRIADIPGSCSSGCSSLEVLFVVISAHLKYAL